MLLVLLALSTTQQNCNHCHRAASVTKSRDPLPSILYYHSHACRVHAAATRKLPSPSLSCLPPTHSSPTGEQKKPYTAPSKWAYNHGTTLAQLSRRCTATSAVSTTAALCWWVDWQCTAQHAPLRPSGPTCRVWLRGRWLGADP